MDQDGVLDDGESQSRSAQLSGSSLVDAVESLEQMRQMLLRNSCSIVGEYEPILAAVFFRTLDGDGRALAGGGKRGFRPGRIRQPFDGNTVYL